MTGEQIIKAVRQLTMDDKIGSETWKNADYLIALNEARAYLYAHCPECRANSDGTRRAYADIDEGSLYEEMDEDEVYRNVLVALVASRFFDSNSFDTANARNAVRFDQKARAELHLLGG